MAERPGVLASGHRGHLDAHADVIRRHALEQSGFLPANAFAFDGARKGWERKVGQGLTEVLAGL